MSAPVLALSEVVKSYPGVRALKGVSLEFLPGEIHALVGENGAGKSTLMGVASGSTLPDSGSVEIAGRTLDPPTPGRAEQLGLGIVYQHPALVADLTVAENMAFSCPPELRPGPRGLDAWARGHLQTLDAEISPGAFVRDLPLADRQLVEIARALSIDPRVLILDEPTEPLLAEEIELLFERTRRIAASGAGVVYISHRIPEVQRIADRISVLRDGELRGTFEASTVSETDIVRLIAGRTFESTFPAKGTVPPTAEPLLRVAGLTGTGFVDVDLDVYPGEIVGLAGVEGNGQHEFLRGLAGVIPSTGEVRVDGEAVSVTGPSAARSSGLVYVAGDRHAEGLFLPASVKDNLTATSLQSVAGWLSERTLRRRAAEQVERLDVKTPTLDAAVGTLSGGNQQKVAIGRSLLEEPRVLLLDGPTQGVDVGSRVEIYRVAREAAKQDRAVVVLSGDGLELEGLCDRVAIFSRGRIAGELSGAELTEQNLIDRALNATGEAVGRATPGGPKWRLWPFFRGDFAPAAAVLVVSLLVVLYTTASASTFLTQETFSSLFLLLAVLAFASLAQQLVVLVGGIDLSIGPSMSLLVVLASFFVTPDKVLGYQLIGLLVMLLVAIGVGVANGLMAEWLRMPPVIATLVTYIILQGFGLLLRPLPKGTIDPVFTDSVGAALGPVPVALIVAVACAVAFDVIIRRTRWGIALRAVGSDDAAAHRLGARVRIVRFSAYAVAGVFVFAAALTFMGQVGIGTAGAGLEYTLSSVTAVVLGGAAIAGGRAAFVGALAGATLIQLVSSALPFLQVSDAWQQWSVGGLILISALAYSQLSRSGAATR